MAVYGVYRGKVVNTQDPYKQNRLVLKVPALFGNETTQWADPVDSVGVLPGPGDLVWVGFQGGDNSKPVWWGGEPDASQQINTFWSDTGKPYVDNSLTSAETYAYDQAGHASASTTTSQTISASTSWADIVFQASSYGNLPGSGNPFNTQYFIAPYDGIFVYAGIAHLGSFTSYVGIRCVTSAGAILSSPPPFDGGSLFTPEISVTGVSHLTSGSSIKLQLRATNGVTINSAAFDVALIKKL